MQFNLCSALAVTQDGGLCWKMITKSISISVNNSVWASTGGTSRPGGRKAGAPAGPGQTPLHSPHPHKAWIYLPWKQRDPTHCYPAIQNEKLFVVHHVKLILHVFSSNSHPLSMDLTRKYSSELGKRGWGLIHAMERKNKNM